MASTTKRETVLVTGANSGIGYECARALASSGKHVIVAARSRALSEDAAARIARESGPGTVEVADLDLASPASVRRLVADVERRDLPLAALVCNAGVQFAGRTATITEQGYEATFAVNHLGHFLLTNLLLSRLLSRTPSRIVVTASGVHDPARTTGMPDPDIADIETLAATGGPVRGRFDGPLAYVNSKLCNLWFSYELARRLDAAGLGRGATGALAVNAFDPGLVPGSHLARDYHPALRFFWYRVLPGVAAALNPVVPGISTAEKSGRALASLVLDPAYAASGARYYPSHTRWAETPSSARSYDERAARELWEASVAMSGLAAGESPLA